MAIKSVSTLGNEQDGGDGGLLSTKKTYDPNFIKDYQGKTYDKTILLNLAKGLAPSIDANRLMGGVYSTKGESIGFDYDEATNALGYAPSAAEQVVLDMARHLMNEGVTNVSQIDATDTNRRFGSTYSGDGGTIYEIKRDENGNLVTSTWGKSTSDMGNIIAAASIAAAFMGVPADIGAAVLGEGASSLAVNTIGGAIFGGGTAALTGGDVVKGALLGGAGGAVGSYLNTAGGAVLGDASDIAMSMADAGSTLAEIETALTNSGFSADVIADSLKDASNVLASTTSTATIVPSTTPSLLDTVSIVAPSTTPALTNLLSAAATIPAITPTTNQITTPTVTTPEQIITDNRPTTIQDVVNTITSVIPTIDSTVTTSTTPATITPEQVITDNRPTTIQDIVNTVTALIPTIPTTTTTTTTPTVDTSTTETKKPFTLTPSDIIRIIQIGGTVAALNAAKNTGSGPTQYDIVPVPTDWTSPQSIAQTWNYPTPVNFGTSDLLKGTQWEKYLSKTPTPNRLNEMNYNQLLESLKSNKPVTINDVITGIQSQYAPPSAGQLSAQRQGMDKTKYINNITDWLNANPNATDAQVRAQMAAFGISQQDVSQALNKPINVIQQKYDAAFTGATPEQKADAYNSLIKQGLTDAQIRSSITTDAGPQTDTDWNYLQQLAATTNPAFTIAQPTLTALQASSPTEKATAYNTLIGQGFNDAQIRGTINNLMGTQTDTDWAALQQYAKAPTLSSLITQIGSGTPQQKASTYNQLLGQGFSDADIFGAANTLLGPQSQTDWAALQSLAKA